MTLAVNDTFPLTQAKIGFGQKRSAAKWGCGRSTFEIRGMTRLAVACPLD
jgi:hypothetical protein